MSMSLFQTVLTVALLLPYSPVTFAQTPQQGVKQDSASVTINPPETTIHVGQTQTFEAVVKGTRSTGIRWAVAERNGGRITEDGIYTAPRHYSHLTQVFGRLLYETRVREEELRGFSEDKLKTIRSFAKFLADDAA
jgi:hypothetical protein